MMSEVELQARAARNQSLFRDYNELLEPSNEAHQLIRPPFADWFCECPRESCSERVKLTLVEYEAVRAVPTHFMVAPDEDHVVPDVERVIVRNERYWVVEKIGVAAAVSEGLDPRAP
jgi:hypothetical protein